MRKIEIEISHLPYSELSPNSRVHWAIKAKAVKASREEIGWLAKAQWHDDKPMMKARISYTFHIKDKRHRDMDNLLAMAKPWQDGLIDAGVIFNDDAQYLEIGHIKVLRSDADQSIVVVEEVITPSAKADGFLGHARTIVPRYVPKAQSEPQDITGCVDISVNHQPTMRAKVNTVSNMQVGF